MRRCRGWARWLVAVSVVFVWCVFAGGSPAAASTQITQIGTLAGQSGDNEFDVSAHSSDDGSVVVFRSSDPALVTALPNGYRPAQLFVWRRATGAVEQASVSASGVKANSYVTEFSLSGDGRFVVFASYATNLGPPCLGAAQCLFRKDLVTGAVISAAPGLFNGNTPGSIGSSTNAPSVSGDGRFVLFRTGLVEGVVVSDLAAGTSRQLTRSGLTGDVPAGPIFVTGTLSYHFVRQTLSDDGRHIVVAGWDGPPGSRTDLYLVDTITRDARRITRAVGGGVANSGSVGVQITPDGSTVLFTSNATNLTADGTGGIFAYDVDTATTELVSIGADGQPQASWTGRAMTDDGRYVLFSDPMTVRDRVAGVSRRITEQASMAPFVGLRGNFDVSGNGSTIVGAGTTGPQVVVNPSVGGLYVFDGYTAPAVDHTPPMMTGTPDRAPGESGWYHAPVTITWSSSDPHPSSGPPTTPPPTVVSSQGADQTFSAQSCDPAGNCTTGHVTVSLDSTPPAVAIGGVTDGASYARDGVPQPTCSANDALSGLAAICTLTVQGGQPDGSGTFTVTAHAADIAGNNGHAWLTYTVEATQVPATPLIASVTMASHSATITWLRPADGGSPILGYAVTATPGIHSCSTEGPDALSCTITGLTNGVNYTFTVTARNAVGDSPPPSGGETGPGTPIGSGTPGTPPGPVPGVQPTPDPGDGTSVTLHWLAAESELPIIGYRATAEPGGRFCTTDGGLSCTITGLTPDLDYTFTVTAINGIGSSDPSDPVSLPPTITALHPTHGSSLGGTAVTISGTYLAATTAVYFGETAATGFNVNADGTLTATTPAHDPGAVDVRIVTPAGTSTISVASKFTYDATADIATTAASAAVSVSLGDAVTQNITVTNRGPDPTQTSTTVTISGTESAAVAVFTTTGTCTNVATQIICDFGTLLNDETAIITVMVEPTATGAITMTAASTGAAPDPLAANNIASVVIDADNAHGCTILTGSGNDTVVGTSGPDVICAFGGDDTIDGGGGDDVIYGGSGHDILDGGNGNDTLYAGNTGSTLIGGNGNDVLIGGAGDDTIRGDNGNDTIQAGDGADTVYGGNGDDTIEAGDGTDNVHGGNGNDTCANTEQPASCTG